MAQTWNNRNTKWNNNRRAPFKQKDKRAPVKLQDSEFGLMTEMLKRQYVNLRRK